MDDKHYIMDKKLAMAIALSAVAIGVALGGGQLIKQVTAPEQCVKLNAEFKHISAIEPCVMAVENGDPQAAFILDEMHKLGVESNKSTGEVQWLDRSLAKDFFEIAAIRGVPEGQYQLAYLLED